MKIKQLCLRLSSEALVLLCSVFCFVVWLIWFEAINIFCYVWETEVKKHCFPTSFVLEWNHRKHYYILKLFTRIRMDPKMSSFIYRIGPREVNSKNHWNTMVQCKAAIIPRTRNENQKQSKQLFRCVITLWKYTWKQIRGRIRFKRHVDVHAASWGREKK